MLEELMFVVERLTEEPGTKKDMNLMLAGFSSKMEKLVLLEKLHGRKNAKDRVKTAVVAFTESQEKSEGSDKEEEEREYIQNLFQGGKAQ